MTHIKMQMRKVQYRLYPNTGQEASFNAAAELHRQLYNAALEERIDAYRKAGVNLSYYDQCKSLKYIRRDDPNYRAISSAALKATLYRLHLAFSAFFRRYKAGEAPGFPRFKSKDRFKGFGFRSHGDGAMFKPGQVRHGRLYIKGVPGLIAARGNPRALGKIHTLDVTRKADHWFLTISVECAPARTCGDDIIALDWGVETLASCVFASGDTLNAQNTRIGRKGARRIKVLSRKLARQKRTSARRRKTKIRLAKARMTEANQRKDRAHKLSAEIVSRAHVIAFETLTIRNMTRSAKGTVDDPGRNVRQKSGLNREVLDTAPAQLMSMLRYKAEEADAWVMEAPTRKLKPSQTCPTCGRQRKKKLSERTHHCECGTTERRDPASARVVLNWALKELAREPGVREDRTPVRSMNRGVAAQGAASVHG